MSKKLFEDLLASFKRSNKERKLKLANKAGYATVEGYKEYLERQINVVLEPVVVAKPVDSSKNTVKPTIHIVDIIDCSGSMSGGKIRNAIKGINDGIKELQNSDIADYIYTICDFSDASDINFSYINKNIKEVGKIDSSARGITALYDAIGITLGKVQDNVLKGEKVLVNIYTDGGENGSRIFSSVGISNLISVLKDDYTVTFIGTSYDVAQVTTILSIESSNTLVYDGSATGLASSMTTNSIARTAYSKNVALGNDVSKGFFKNVVKK